MRRASAFQRDFEDLHGPGSFQRYEAVPLTKAAPSWPDRFTALMLVAMASFWVVLLAVVVLGLLVLGGVFVWALFTAPTP